MKYPASLYAEALLSVWSNASEQSKKDIPARFLRVLERHGDSKYAKSIFELIQKKLIIQNNGTVIRLEFARTPSDAMLTMVAGFLSKKDFVKTTINPSLGAGMRIVMNEEQELDYSLAYKLKQMFACKSV